MTTTSWIVPMMNQGQLVEWTVHDVDNNAVMDWEIETTTATADITTTATTNWKIRLHYPTTATTTWDMPLTATMGWDSGSATTFSNYPIHIEYSPISTYATYQFTPKPETKEEYLKRKVKEMVTSRCQAPNIIRNRRALDSTTDIREQRARETLRRVIGEDKFFSFLRNGFVTVRAKSGLVYQIFPGHGFTRVYEKGQEKEQICVVLRGDFPPTDSLIMRYILILNNEKKFRDMANCLQPYKKYEKMGPQPRKTLAEEFRELKLKTA